jgi:RHS repeat-associated protein
LINNAPVSLGSDGKYQFISDTAGVFKVEALAFDAAGNEGNANGEIITLTEGDTEKPIAEISAPGEGTKLSLPTEIVGTASDTNILIYKIEYSVKDKNEFIEFASGKVSVNNGVLGTIDPTMLRNGLYDIRLTVKDTSNNTSIITRTFQMDGEIKVGNFSMSFNDLTIPVSGIPITITRSYDSRNVAKGDFGMCWNLGIEDIEISESCPLGEYWGENITGGMFQTYSIYETKPHIITVTFPDGHTDEFTIALNPSSQRLIPLQQTTVSFSPRSGTLSKLEAMGNNICWIMGGSTGDELLGDDFTPYNPDTYKLTTVDGTEYLINQHSGIESIKDVNGNTVTFGPDGINHSSGKSVKFERDNLGRVIAISDPEDNMISYEYDYYGDLVEVTDQVGNITGFKYNSRHQLVDIIDPRGIKPVKNEYDDEGRLIAHVDSNGNRVEYTHNIGSRQESVKDRLGNISVYSYDDKGNVLQKIDPAGGITNYTYDNRNNKLSETDSLSNTTKYTYDEKNNMTSQTDPLGNKTEYTYDSSGRVLSTKDPEGNTTVNTYDEKGCLTSTTDTMGNKTTYEYNSGGHLIKTVNQAGDATEYTYDSYGNKTSEKDADGNVTTYTYDANGNQLTKTLRRTTQTGIQNITFKYVYDGMNRIVKTIDPYGNISGNEYNSIGKQSMTIDSMGYRTEYEYDLYGNLIKTKYPDGSEESSTYDTDNKKLSFKDKNGRITKFEYDRLGRLTKTVFSDGTFIESVYDAVGNVVKTIDERGNSTIYKYNGAGKKISVTNALGFTVSYEYNKNGNRVKTTNELGNSTIYEYNEVGRLTKTIFSDGTFKSITYDKLGRKISETDQAGKTTKFGYNKNGNLVKVTDALNNTTEFAYDEVGNMISQTDANGNETKYEYDNLGRTIKRVLPIGMYETFTYDKVGNVIEHMDFNRSVTKFEYNKVGKLIKKIFPDASSEIYDYTLTGQRKSVYDSRGTTYYEYDLRDRLIKQTNPDNSAITYTYDDAGNCIALKTVSGTTSYSYDGLNRLISVTASDGSNTTYTYDKAGNRTGIVYPNKILTEYIYDNMNRLIQMVNKKSGGEVISSYQYTLGPSGNRTKVIENTGRVVEYIYDDTYKLLKENIIDFLAGNRYINYSYDAVGNRLTRDDNGTITVYKWDKNDRMLLEGDNEYSYDNNGNTLSKDSSSEKANYSYDFQNRLIGISISNRSGTSAIQYKYDVDGIRVQKILDQTTVSNYIVDKNREHAQVIEERDGNNNLVVSYVYGDDLISQKRGTNTSYYLYDGQGSTRMLTDGDQNVTDIYYYDAFGQIMHKSGTTENECLYTGERYDPNLGFYYLRSRYYNPSAGRFLTADSFSGMTFDPTTLHKYNYCRNNPVNLTDPEGMFWGSIGGMLIASAIMGMLASLATIGLGMLNYYSYPATLRGTMIHEAIFAFYRPLGYTCNAWIAKSSNPPIDRHRPDIRHHGPGPFTGEVYEIKPIGELAEGIIQLGDYIATLSVRYPGINWHPGFSYLKCPNVIKLPQFPFVNINVELIEPGMIVYYATPDYTKAALVGLAVFALTLLILLINAGVPAISLGGAFPKPVPVPA